MVGTLNRNMLEKEKVYLLALSRALEGRKEFTQKGLAEELGISLSTVSNALKPLVKMNAVRVGKNGFVVSDFGKALVYLATIRDIGSEIEYATFAPERPDRIEASLPSDSVFTAYSAFRKKYEGPSDYSEVYVYSESVDEIKKRFPEKKGPKNLFALKSNETIMKLSGGNCAPLPLIFADLWNLPEWYAKDYLEKAKETILKKTGEK